MNRLVDAVPSQTSGRPPRLPRPGAGVAQVVALSILALLVVPPAPGAAQEETDPVAPQRRTALTPGDTVLATPDSRFPAGTLHRWVMGDGWRELWPLRVEAPVLDLERFAGGLEPLRLGGGQQTRSLRFRGSDGLVYNFRSIDKDAGRTLDPVLRNTLAEDFVRDQISALFPLSAMVVAPILDAAGVLHPDPRLVVLPDDPALGEFREEFAGLLGWIEQRPDELDDDRPGFAGSSRVVGSDRLLERLEEDPDDRADARAFLRARLLDFLVGDWDRHPDQWRWAGYDGPDGTLVFEPVPRDRDWALSRLDGVVAAVSVWVWPNYVGFGREYPSAFRLSWSGRALDRRLLTGLEWPAWEAEVDSLLSQVTPEVVEGAVAALPESYRREVGAWLSDALLARREALPGLARDFYRLLAGEVEVWGTDEEDEARLERLPDGGVAVEIVSRDGDRDGEVLFRRTFHPGETREVRVELRGGDDRAVVEGAPDGPIVLRVLGGGSDDVLIDRTTGEGVHFYDDRGDNVFERAPGTGLDRRAWDEPFDPEETTHQAGYRSWGSRWMPLPVASFTPDQGLLLGAGVQWTDYGFRHWPYERRVEVEAGATFGGRGRASALLDVPLGDRAVRGVLRLSADGTRASRFYGFGNGTSAGDGEGDRFRADRTEYRLHATARGRPAEGVHLASGLEVAAFRPFDSEGTLVDSLRPYGWGAFEQAVLTASAGWDGLPSDPAEPGFRVALDARFGPTVLDVADPFGSVAVEGELRLVHDAGGRAGPSLALGAGAEKVWGTAPLHEAAYLGGPGSLRGFRSQRFAGDALLRGGLELRLPVADVLFILPGRFGVTGLVDTGRVFGGDVPSDGWHTGVGAGVWMRWVDAYTASLSVARSDEFTGVYFSVGVPIS